MKSSQYLKPRTLHEVLALLAKHGSAARLLAGGTDFMVRFRRRQWNPAVIIDLKGADGLDGEIRKSGGMVRIGARVVMADLVTHPLIRQHYPALAEAANVVGSVQIRNRATLGGNICNASPAADTAPPLLAYGAIVNVAGEGRSRAIPIDQFFTGPGTSALATGEMLVSIDLPVPASFAGSSFGRITRRWGVDLATINIGCFVLASGETRLAYGAVGPKPFVVTDTTGMLSSPHVSAQDKESVLRRFVSRAEPRADVRAGLEYRRAMLAVMSRRCLETAIRRQRSSG